MTNRFRTAARGFSIQCIPHIENRTCDKQWCHTPVPSSREIKRGPAFAEEPARLKRLDREGDNKFVNIDMDRRLLGTG